MTHAQGIIGHQALVASLESDLATGNVAHAYLFTGPAHVGKFTVAKWFAKQLLLTDVPEADRARTQQTIEKLIHPDLFVIDKLWIEEVSEDIDVIAQYSNIQQDHRKKAKAKTDTISIDDIRAMQERLHQVRSGHYRCCLIRSMERMQTEAVNALLKILEEPPEGLVFILTTAAADALLPTLVSRARVVRFSRVEEKELHSQLKGIDEEERRFLLHLSQGAPGILLALQRDPEALRRAKSVHNAASAFWRSTSLVERLELLKPLHDRGAEADDLLLHLALALREQSPLSTIRAGTEFHTFLRGLETNVSRQLLAQRFVLGLS